MFFFVPICLTLDYAVRAVCTAGSKTFFILCSIFCACPRCSFATDYRNYSHYQFNLSYFTEVLTNLRDQARTPDSHTAIDVGKHTRCKSGTLQTSTETCSSALHLVASSPHKGSACGCTSGSSPGCSASAARCSPR